MLCCFGRLVGAAADDEKGVPPKADLALTKTTAVVHARNLDKPIINCQTAVGSCPVERRPNTSKKDNLPPGVYFSHGHERWRSRLLEQLSLLAATDRLRAAGCWVVDGHRGKCFLLAQAPTSQTAVRASLLGCSVGASIKLKNDTETSVVLAINSKAPVCILAPAQGQPPFWPSDHRQLHDRLHQADGGTRNEPAASNPYTALAWRLLALPLIVGDEVGSVLVVTELVDTAAIPDGQRSCFDAPCSPPEHLLAASRRMAQEFFGSDEERAYALRLCELVEAVAEAPMHDAAIRSAALSIQSLISTAYTHLPGHLRVTCGLVLPARGLIHASKCGTSSTGHANPGGGQPYITSPHTGSSTAIATTPAGAAATGSTLHLYCSQPIAVPTHRTLLACEPVRPNELAMLLTEALSAPVSSTAAAAAAAAAARTSSASLGPGPGPGVASGSGGSRQGPGTCGPQRQPHHKRLALRCPEEDAAALPRCELEALEAVGARCPRGSVILASCPLPSTLCAVVAYVCVVQPPPPAAAAAPVSTTVAAVTGQPEAHTELAAAYSDPCGAVLNHAGVDRTQAGDKQQQEEQHLSEEQLESILQHVSSAVEVMAGALEQRLLSSCLPQQQQQHQPPQMSLAPLGGRAVGVLEVAAEPQGLLTVSFAGTEADDSMGFWASTSGPFLSGISTPSSQLPLGGSVFGSGTTKLHSFSTTVGGGPHRRPGHGALPSHHAASSTPLRLTSATTTSSTDTASGLRATCLHASETAPGEAAVASGGDGACASVSPEPSDLASPHIKEEEEGIVEEEDMARGAVQEAATAAALFGSDVQAGSAVAVGMHVQHVSGSPELPVTSATVDLERCNPASGLLWLASTGGQRLPRLGLEAQSCGTGSGGASRAAACSAGGQKCQGGEESVVVPTGVAVLEMGLCGKSGEGDTWDGVAVAAGTTPVMLHPRTMGWSDQVPLATALAAGSSENRPPPSAPATASEGGHGARRLRPLQVLSLDKAALQLQRPRNSSSPVKTATPKLSFPVIHASPGPPTAASQPDAGAAAPEGCLAQLLPPPPPPPAPHTCSPTPNPHPQLPQPPQPQPSQPSVHPQRPQPQPDSSHLHPGVPGSVSAASNTGASPRAAPSTPSATPPPLPYVPFMPRRLNRMYLAASSGGQQPLLNGAAAAVTAAAAAAAVGTAQPAHVVAAATVVAGPFLAGDGSLSSTATAPHDDTATPRAAVSSAGLPRPGGSTIAQAAAVVLEAALPDISNMRTAAPASPSSASAGPAVPSFPPTSTSHAFPHTLPSPRRIPPPHPQPFAPQPRPAAPTAHPLPLRSLAAQPVHRQLSDYAIPEDAPLVSNVTETVALMRSLSQARGAHLSTRMGRLRLTAKIQSAHMSALPAQLPSRLEQMVGASMGGGGGGGGWVLTSVAARRGCIELVCDFLMTRHGSGDSTGSDDVMSWEQGATTHRRIQAPPQPYTPFVRRPSSPHQQQPQEQQVLCNRGPADRGTTRPGKETGPTRGGGHGTPAGAAAPLCVEQHWLQTECGLRPEALGGLLERCGLLSPASDPSVQMQIGHSVAGVTTLSWDPAGGGRWVSSSCAAVSSSAPGPHAATDGGRDADGLRPNGSGDMDVGSPLEAPVLWLPCPVVMPRGPTTLQRGIQLYRMSTVAPCSGIDDDEVTVRCASGYLPCRLSPSVNRSSQQPVSGTRRSHYDGKSNAVPPSSSSSVSTRSRPNEGAISLPEDEPGARPATAAATGDIGDCSSVVLQVTGPLPPNGGLLLVECRRTRRAPPSSASDSAAAAVDAAAGSNSSSSSRRSRGMRPHQVVTSPPVPLLLLPVEHWAAAAELRQLRTHMARVLLPSSVPSSSSSASPPRQHAAEDAMGEQRPPQRRATDGRRNTVGPSAASAEAAAKVEMACQQFLMDLGLLLDAAAAVRSARSLHHTPTRSSSSSAESHSGDSSNNSTSKNSTSKNSTSNNDSTSNNEGGGKLRSFAADMQLLLQPRHGTASTSEGAQHSTGNNRFVTDGSGGRDGGWYDDYLMDAACTLLAASRMAGLERTAAMVLDLACGELALGRPEVLSAGLGPMYGSAESCLRRNLIVRREALRYPVGHRNGPAAPSPLAAGAARSSCYDSAPSILASADFQHALASRTGPRREENFAVGDGAVTAAAAPRCCLKEGCGGSAVPAHGAVSQPPACATEYTRYGCGCVCSRATSEGTASASFGSWMRTTRHAAAASVAAASVSARPPLDARPPPSTHRSPLSVAVVGACMLDRNDSLTPPNTPKGQAAVCSCGCGRCKRPEAATCTTTATITSAATAATTTTDVDARHRDIEQGWRLPSLPSLMQLIIGRHGPADMAPSARGRCSWMAVYGGSEKVVNAEQGCAMQDRGACGRNAWLSFIPLLLPLPCVLICGGLAPSGSNTGLVQLLSSEPQVVLVPTLLITALCLLVSVRKSRTSHTAFTGAAGTH